MLRNRNFLKTIAVFFLINFLTAIFSDTIVALAESKTTQQVSKSTGGTIPSSVNDGNVDLKTGDYSYTLPIMEVPGPEGNYPISLTYQSGIQLNQTASWVGLGWDLDAGGSISRSISGFPDDFAGVPYSVNDNWTSTTPSSNGGLVVPQFNVAQSLQTDLTSSDFIGSMNCPFKTPQKFGNNSTTSATGSSGVNIYGALMASETAPYFNSVDNSNAPANVSYDCDCKYNPTYWVTGDAPDNTTGGCMPTIDYYMVSGSGTSGIIEPIILDNGSLFKNQASYPDVNGTSSTGNPSINYPIQYTFNNPHYSFRFKNDFSNSLSANSNLYGGNGNGYWVQPTSYPSTGYELNVGYGGVGILPVSGNCAAIAGSNDIEYYLNENIVQNYAQNAGFIDYQDLQKSGRNTFATQQTNGVSYNMSEQIGGFSITNSEGVTYHYALPVYTYNSSKSLTATNIAYGRTSRIISFNQPYAYAWMLTTITGADFIDSNGNGVADESDQGSWTNFFYGRYTNQYLSRNPYFGMNTASDGSISFSSAYMEVYYLDAISTRTHTALFQKSTRNDNFDVDPIDNTGAGQATVQGSTGTLKLDNILLYNNQKLMSITGQSTIYTAIEAAKSQGIPDIFDMTDLTSIDQYYNTNNSNNIQYVNFETDYSLMLHSPDNNSSSSSTQSGRLTLNQVNFYGANGSSGTNGTYLKPPVVFTYDLPAPSTDIILGFSSNGTVGGVASYEMNTKNNNFFSAGNIITFSSSGISYYALITANPYNGGDTYLITFLGQIPNSNILSSNSLNISASTTKNPPYFNNFYDMWGYFKSDYTGLSGVSNIDRQVSTISSANTDVWSLRTITTSLGATITINYESDSYIQNEYPQERIYNLEQSFWETYSAATPETTAAGIYLIYSPPPSDPSGNGWLPSTNFFNANSFGGCATCGSGMSCIQFTVNEIMNPADIPQPGSTINMTTIGGIYGGTNYFNIPTGGSSVSGTGPFVVTSTSTNSNGQTLIAGYFLIIWGNVYGSTSNPLAIAQTEGLNNLDPADSYIFKHYGSYITLPVSDVVYGGGVRTKSVTVQESTNGDQFQTLYDYNNKSTGITSGITSYEPLTYTQVDAPTTGNFPATYTSYNTNNNVTFNIGNVESNYLYVYDLYYQAYLKLYGKVVAYSSFINPGVIYSTVHKSEWGNGTQVPTYNEYIFQTYNDTLFQRIRHGFNSSSTSSDSANIIALKDYTSCVGNLLSQRTYDLNNNILNQIDYLYDNAENAPRKQGVLEQVFYMNSIYSYTDPPTIHNLFNNALVTIKGEYPYYLKEIITRDYLKGITNTVAYKSFDFYSGQAKDVEYTDSYGNTKIATTQPAYSVYNSMGLKLLNSVNNTSNKNMLTQPCANYKYKTETWNITPQQISATGLSSSCTTYVYSITLPWLLPTCYSVGSMVDVNGKMYQITQISTAQNDNQNIQVTGYDLFPTQTNGSTITVKYSLFSANIQTWTNGTSVYRQYDNNSTINSTTNPAYTYYDNYSVADNQFRSFRNYIWNSPYLNVDGTYFNYNGTPGGLNYNFAEFNWSQELSNTTQTGPYWQKVKENTLYDVHSNLLEYKDVNGNYASIKKDANQDNLVSTASNSNYCSSFYWSFEDNGGEVGWGETLTQQNGSVVPHTGNWMSSITSSQEWGPTYRAQYLPSSIRTQGNIIQGKTYQASVWVHESSDPKTILWITAGGTSGGSTYWGQDSTSLKMSTTKVGNWYLLTTTLALPSDYVSQGSSQNDIRVFVQNAGTLTSYVDDMMFHPVDADLSGYVYDPNTNLPLYKLDGNGFFTQYNYDNNHQLISTFKETLKGVKQTSLHQYHY